MPKGKPVNNEKFRRINKPDEEKLYAVVNASMIIRDTDSDAEKLQKQKMQERVEAFQAKYARVPASKNGAVEPKRLAYETIPEFLKAAGLSYKDLLEITNGNGTERAQLTWPSKIEKNMCSACDALPAAIRKKVYDIVLDTLPAPMHEILFSKDTTGQKVFDAAVARKNENGEVWNKIKDDIFLRNIYVYRDEPGRSCDMLPFGKYSTMARDFDVSYHWLLGLDEKACVMARNGMTELIMDAFCLLPDEWKQRIYAGVKQAADNVKANKGKE